MAGGTSPKGRSLTPLLILDLFGLVGVANLQPHFIGFVEAVALQRLHSDGSLQRRLKVNEAEIVEAVVVCCLGDESDALEAGERAEDIYDRRMDVRLTSRSLVSLGTPSTYRLLVESLP